MKKVLRFFSLLLISTFIMALFTAKQASAIYDSSKNGVNVFVGTVTDGETKKLNLQIIIDYQRGYDATAAALGYKICEKKTDDSLLTYETYCESSFVGIGAEVSEKDANAADQYPTSRTYNLKQEGYTIDSSHREDQYVVFVRVAFCSFRNEDKTACQYYSEDVGYARREFKVGDILSTNINDIENDELESVMEKITGLVYGTIMPIIYIVLTLFLIIKGAILGVQIVKAADEPQLRQEKIGSLKWLIIGCGIAYAASALVSVLTGFFSGAFNF